MTNDDNGRGQARAQFESIVEMVAALKLARAIDAGEHDWSEDATARGFIETDDGWHKPGFNRDKTDTTGDEVFGDAEDACRAFATEDYPSEGEARQAIDEDALSVEIRSGWYTPGATPEPEEYCILLCTGGPAVRIVGKLGQWCEPETARLEFQDWFKPWTEYRGDTDERGALAFPGGIDPSEAESIMLEYARVFWFGEG